MASTELACDRHRAPDGPSATPTTNMRAQRSGQSLLGAATTGGALRVARWASTQVLTQSVTLDTAPAPGFVQVRVPAGGAALEGSFGIAPDRWPALKSGPFRFAVVVVTARKAEDRGVRKLVLEEFIDPARVAEDRKWFPMSVDLDEFSGQDVLLALSASTANLVDDPADLAGWAEPRLVQRALATRAPDPS